MFNFFGAKKKPDASKQRPKLSVTPAFVTVDGEWRFKPVGKIASPWSKVTIGDLSRVSANMTADRDFKPQAVIELRMMLEAGHPLTVDATIVRAEKTGTKYKVALAFQHVNDESAHLVTRFVNKHLTEQRVRGLA